MKVTSQVFFKFHVFGIFFGMFFLFSYFLVVCAFVFVSFWFQDAQEEEEGADSWTFRCFSTVFITFWIILCI